MTKKSAINTMVDFIFTKEKVVTPGKKKGKRNDD